MNKLLSAMIVAAVASFSFSAHAASHAGGAPMKADAAKPAASAPAKAASGAAKKDAAKPEAKKEEPKK